MQPYWKSNHNQIITTIIDIIFWDFLILYQIFFSPQVKQSVIISKKKWYIRVVSRVAEQLKT